jgi:hypothetical protein
MTGPLILLFVGLFLLIAGSIELALGGLKR